MKLIIEKTATADLVRIYNHFAEKPVKQFRRRAEAEYRTKKAVETVVACSSKAKIDEKFKSIDPKLVEFFEDQKKLKVTKACQKILATIKVIGGEEECEIEDVAAKLEVESHTLTKDISKLEKQGLISISDDTYSVQATEFGQSYFEANEEAVAAAALPSGKGGLGKAGRKAEHNTKVLVTLFPYIPTRNGSRRDGAYRSIISGKTTVEEFCAANAASDLRLLVIYGMVAPLNEEELEAFNAGKTTTKDLRKQFYVAGKGRTPLAELEAKIENYNK